MLKALAGAALLLGCGRPPAALHSTDATCAPPVRASTPAAAAPLPNTQLQPSGVIAVAGEPEPAAPRCAPADWSARGLAPLLERGSATAGFQPDRDGAAQLLFSDECTDSPRQGALRATGAVVVDGVEVRLLSATPAGSSGRGWAGNQCQFEVRLADGSGVASRLDEAHVPPFTTIGAVVRSGSAAWFSLAFNGYTKEFPKGGNRVVAVDLCEGRVVWQSKNSTSNSGLLLLDDYLISPYGFTNERRFVYVFDARSGALVQKLPVLENICPSQSWAPNWRPGERCDAPGQLVGAATAPRVAGGVLLVDTNTGSASFQFKSRR